MKTTALIAAVMVTIGLGAASSPGDFFQDDFFNDSEDSFFSDGSSVDISFDDDFFSDDSSNEEDEERSEDGENSSEEGNETDSEEDEVGVCVIGVDSPCNSEEYDGDNETDSDETQTPEEGEEPEDGNESDGSENETDEPENSPEEGNETDPNEVSEEAYVQEAPEPGDEYYEAGTEDWVSYTNPRDEYHPERSSRDEYPGSGRVCMALLNEEGEPITGETVPDTQAFMDLDGIDWHSESTFNVEFPLTENYERPLDSDMFGTSEDLPQGDGYMDAHCIEYHLVTEDHTLNYSQVEISGENSEAIEVVGYHDQIGTWNTDFDPESDVEPYGTSNSSDGTVTLEPGNSHGEVLAVLQLNR